MVLFLIGLLTLFITDSIIESVVQAAAGFMVPVVISALEEDRWVERADGRADARTHARTITG